MAYRAQNVDTEKALDALEYAMRQQEQITDREIAEKKAYKEGFMAGIRWVEGMVFGTSNYEKENKNE